MIAWLQRWMYGRYGSDALGRFLSVFALALYAVASLTQLTLLHALALLLLVGSVYRMLSRDAEKRWQENQAFLRAKGKLVQSFNWTKIRLQQRKTHRFYRCPVCKQQLRVPKGKGRIIISCPKCHASFKKTT